MDEQLTKVLAANDIYRLTRPPVAPRPPEPARRLVILTCMDARIDVSGALGLDVGDAHILRNAGGRASTDAIRSLVVSAHLLGTREAGVIHHTRCGLEGRTNAELAQRTGVHDMEFLPFAQLEQSVHHDVGTIRRCGHLPPDFVTWGAVYDVDTGALEIVVEPEGAAEPEPEPEAG